MENKRQDGVLENSSLKGQITESSKLEVNEKSKEIPRTISSDVNGKVTKSRQSCDSFWVHNLQETTFVCTISIYNFCLHFCNWQLFYALLQLLTFKCTFTIANILWNMANEIYCMSNCIWELLYALLYFNVFMFHQIDIFCMHNWIWYLFARLE